VSLDSRLSPHARLFSQTFGGMDLDTFLATALPELPEDARKRLHNDYGLSDYMANVVTGDPPAIQLFDDAVAESRNQLEENSSNNAPESVANLLCNELFALVREHEGHEATDADSENSVKYSKVSAKQLGEVVALLEEGTISNTMAKQLLRILYTEDIDREPRVVANEKGFQLITDPDELAVICREVIDDSPEELERYKLGGKFARKITKFFLGKAMAASRGNAHPERLNEVLMEVLQEVAPEVDNP
jgi:aspartyl-tRNA(Asn)/glutamyl-tRNA(Gln) amidotransferase subunit B